MKAGLIVTPETAIKFSKASVLLAYMFAPSNANKFRLLLFKIFRWISVLLSLYLALFIGLVFSIMENVEKLFLVLKALALMCGMVNYVAKVVIVKIYGKEFEILVGYQCSAGVTVDSQMAIYLWYLCVRFEGLIIQMDYVKNQYQLAQFIRNHQSLLLLTKEVIPPIRAVIFSSVAINKFIMICAGFVLLSNETSFEKVQCAIIMSFIALNIYTFIWPADCLIDVTSYGVSSKVLDRFRTWTLEMEKSCVLIMLRAQQPVVINIPGFLETLSNQYYSSFLSAAFSVFTALRAALNS